mmetsp:Transcript_103254/g.301186  ORF Transcript_103254/g.301186 Transcript_103254/m.301186 type:complete len:388 (+) Transcript_103254:52-1215(+)
MKLAVLVAVLALSVASFFHFCPMHVDGFKEFLPLVWGCATDANPWCSVGFLGWLYRLHLDLFAGMGTETAEQIASKHLAAGPSLEGRVAIITGANSGIGRETARVMMMRGCHVVLAVRTVSKGERELAELSKELGLDATNSGRVLQLDLSDLDSVKAFAAAFLKLELPLHYFVANAGVMALPERKVSKQGYEMQFASNHVGHFLLARLLESKILASGTSAAPARVVFVSSAGHDMWENKGKGSPTERLADQIPPTREYDPFMVYGLTKALNVLTAAQLQRRWGEGGTAVAVSVHPGLIKTNLLNSNAGIEVLFFGPLYAPMHKSVAQGASTTLHCLVAPEVVAEARRDVVAYYGNNILTPPNVLMQNASIQAESWRMTEKLVSKWLA